MSTRHTGPGIRTRVLLLVCLFAVIAGSTIVSLFIVRNRLQSQIHDELATDLQHSVETFQDLEERRRDALEREDRLLASLPSLKALMTTSDRRTIADGAVDFWKTSGNDLFALADSDGHVLSLNVQSTPDMPSLTHALEVGLQRPEQHYVVSAGQIFEYSVQPLIFGPARSGTLLGYVINGYPIDHRFLLEIARGAGAQAALLANGTVAVSTWPADQQQRLHFPVAAIQGSGPVATRVGNERFLTVSNDISSSAGVPLRLIVLKSFDVAQRTIRDIDRLLLLSSMLAILAGSILMVLLARMLTRPLELLAAGVRAFGEGNAQYSLPSAGTQEVRYLSRVFARMRDENLKTGRALLESERLATIGRMASSVSHDLRHYLAAIYANAEFLASPALPANERAELFDEIRFAVNGTTDMLDALLIFGRTGKAVRRQPTTLASVVERAAALVRAHPDAASVTIFLEGAGVDTQASLDSTQVERAVLNLLLNACQAARQVATKPEVRITQLGDKVRVGVIIQDNGPGVPEDIRESLFAPFVSRGKQKGTGLGLTLAASVAREHGGTVELLSSIPGETLFRLTLARATSLDSGSPSQEPVSTQVAL